MNKSREKGKNKKISHQGIVQLTGLSEFSSSGPAAEHGGGGTDVRGRRLNVYTKEKVQYANAYVKNCLRMRG